MKFLNSDSLLELLEREKILTPKQRKFLMQEKGKRRQKLLRALSPEERKDRNAVDLVDVIVSCNFGLGGSKSVAIDEDAIMKAVAAEFKMEFRKPNPLKLDIDVVTKIISKNFAVGHLVLPLELVGNQLTVAVYHPDSESVLHDIEQASQLQVTACIATKSDILRILAEFFGFQTSITAAESQYTETSHDLSLDIGNLEQYVRLSASREITSSDQHIKSAVNHLFSYALDQRASDIHIEPKRDVSMVRFRIDGVLHTIYNLPKAVHSALISRIKFLARLDIAEKRRPQDGRIKLGTKADRDVEVRVSTVPVSFGEKVVLRILDSSAAVQTVAKLGFSERDYKVYKSFMNSPHGIILVTGPTGSGKSTTLYSTLKEISTPEKNIVTVEDPVEMVDEEFNQIAVQPLIDVTFSTILRNILRQDPDIIMIGEIRDNETAAHAVQAAMTGHLVFSTLHTNDAVSAIARLEDLGLEPFMISSTLLGCMAQRLVKKICQDCAEEYLVDGKKLADLGFPVETTGPVKLKRGQGCNECRGTGYHGRCGIFEIFPLSPAIKKMIGTGIPSMEMQQLAIREGMTTLREDAWRKVRAGVTTVEEVLRVTANDVL